MSMIFNAKIIKYNYTRIMNNAYQLVSDLALSGPNFNYILSSVNRTDKLLRMLLMSQYDTTSLISPMLIGQSQGNKYYVSLPSLPSGYVGHVFHYL